MTEVSAQLSVQVILHHRDQLERLMKTSPYKMKVADPPDKFKYNHIYDI